jgi:hypothetical protein
VTSTISRRSSSPNELSPSTDSVNVRCVIKQVVLVLPSYVGRSLDTWKLRIFPRPAIGPE